MEPSPREKWMRSSVAIESKDIPAHNVPMWLLRGRLQEFGNVENVDINLRPTLTR